MIEQLPTFRELGTPEELLSSLTGLGYLLSDEAKLPEAEEMFKEALNLARRTSQDTNSHASYGNSRDLAEALSNLASVLAREGNLAKADALRQENVAVLRKIPGDHRLEIAQALWQLANFRTQQGRKAE